MKLRFKNIGIDEGLSQSTVSCVFQDHMGYMWVGTNDGLNRLDGHNIKIYKAQQNNPHSLLDVSIIAVFEDAQKRLWVVNRSNGGFNLYNRKTEQFERFPAPSREGLWSAQRDGDDHFLAGTQWGNLYRFNLQLGTYKKIPLNAKSQNLGVPIVAVYPCPSGDIWLGTLGQGLLIVPKGSQEARPWRNDLGQQVDSDTVRVLFEDGNDIWVGSNNGLYKITLETGEMVHFKADPNKRHNLRSSSIRGVQKRDGYLWIATTQGLSVYIPELNYFLTYTNDPTSPHSLSSNRAELTYFSREGVLWVGTSDNGLSIADPKIQRFGHVGFQAGNPHGLNHGSVWDLAEDREGTLWVATSNGLSGRNPQTGIFKRYNHDPKNSDSLSGDMVRCIAIDNHGIWLGIMGQGLNFLDKEGKATHYRSDPENPRSLSDDRVLSVHMDREERLWVGTYVGGLNRLDEDGGFTRYDYKPNQPDSLGSSRVWHITSDRENILWLATANGLSRMNPKTGKFRRYLHDPLDPQSLSHNILGYVYVDSKDQVWCGTISGLNRLEPNGSFRQYRANDQMLSDYVYCLLEADDGFLWLGTNSGLVRLNPETGEADTYLMEDGLQSNEFNAGACYKAPDGKLYFGGIDGYNGFYPSDVQEEVRQPQVVLTDFLMQNKSVPLDLENEDALRKVAVDHLKEIELSHQDYLFGFAFSSLDFSNPEKNRYAYKLEGLDGAWLETDGRKPFATYTNLSPGRYRFLVKGAVPHGRWGKPTVQVNLKVHPPLWLTPWAIGSYILVFLALVLLYLRAQSRKLRQQKEAAEKERRINARLRQVDKLKDEFLANTSHELRTPLNGIIGLAESLVDGATGPLEDLTVSNLSMIINSGRRLASLVDDILDFAKLKDRSLHLSKRPVDMYSLCDVVLALSRPLTAGKDLVLENRISEDVVCVMGDENRLQQIMHNLIGNAVKFTESGSVIVDSCEKDGMLVVRVTDTGIGIEECDQERIFESFEQADGNVSRAYGGTGLGLALTRQLVELHGGTICVTSRQGKGSCFSFTLPISKEQRQTVTQVKQLEREECREANTFAPLETQEEAEESLSLHGALILIVDDEPVNRQVLRNHLALKNYEIVEASNGREALDLVSQHRFDIILLDIMMPRMNGYEVCERLREAYEVQELPILFLTARNQVNDLKQGFAVGANDYLTKPIAKDELFSRIHTHLELLHTNRNLEQRVAERTRELHERNRLLDERNQEILRTRDQLILSEKMASLGTLTAGIAHEIRNPLTFINGFAEVSHDLSRELREELEDARECLKAEPYESIDSALKDLGRNTDKIREHGRRANQIVQNMIVLSRGEGGERSCVDLNRLVHEFICLAWQGGLTHLGEDYGFSLEEDYDEQMGEHQVMAQNLSRALINLVNNAMEALAERADEEGMDYRGYLKVWTQRTADAVLIGFRDNGPGIIEENMNRVFTPFFTTKISQNNVGLGLSLCYEIVVREHGGSLDISSQQGSTEVIIRLPLL